MTIEMIGGEVVARTKAKGSKRKAAEARGDQPEPRKRKRKAESAATGDARPAGSAAMTETPPPAPDAATAPSRRGKKNDASTPPTEPASLNARTPGHDAVPIAEPAPNRGATLADVGAGYLAHLEATGKSEGTVFSYRLELAVALDELGKDTAVRAVTADRIQTFFTSERVTKTRSGRMKSQLSIDKTRRVLRQALQWAVERSIAHAGIVAVD